jgi:hypothetical protein
LRVDRGNKDNPGTQQSREQTTPVGKPVSPHGIRIVLDRGAPLWRALCDSVQVVGEAVARAYAVIGVERRRAAEHGHAGRVAAHNVNIDAALHSVAPAGTARGKKPKDETSDARAAYRPIAEELYGDAPALSSTGRQQLFQREAQKMQTAIRMHPPRVVQKLLRAVIEAGYRAEDTGQGAARFEAARSRLGMSTVGALRREMNKVVLKLWTGDASDDDRLPPSVRARRGDLVLPGATYTGARTATYKYDRHTTAYFLGNMRAQSRLPPRARVRDRGGRRPTT